MDLDIEDLEGYVGELEWMQTRQLPYVRTERLKTLLTAFGFQLRQSSSHINFKHPDARFSARGVIVANSEKKDPYLDVAQACLEVYASLKAEQEQKPLAENFEAQAIDQDVEVDFKNWGEEIDLGNGYVVLRSRKWPCIGVETPNDLETRIREIKSLKDRAEGFAVLAHQTANRCNLRARASSNGNEMVSWVNGTVYSMPAFSSDQDTSPEALLTRIEKDVQERDQILVSEMDKMIGLFFDDSGETEFKLPYTQRLAKKKTLDLNIGFHGALSELQYTPEGRFSANFYALLAKHVQEVIVTYLKPKNLKKMGFDVNEVSGHIRAQHRLDPNFSFEVPNPDFDFPDSVRNLTLGSLDTEAFRSDMGQTSAYLEAIADTYEPMFSVLREMRRQNNANDRRLVQELGNNFGVNVKKLALGDVQPVFLSNMLGKRIAVRSMIVPATFQSFDSGPRASNKQLILTAELDRVLQPTHVQPVFKPAVEGGDDPLAGISGLRRKGKSGSNPLPGVLPPPKPPWEEN